MFLVNESSEPLSEAELAARAARRADFVKKRNDTFTKARAERKVALEQSAPAIQKALDGYRSLDTGEVPIIRIRREFVRLADARPQPNTEIPYVLRRDEDLKSRPPLTRLINRKSRALGFYMTAIYVAHLENEPGKAVTNTRHNTFGDTAWATLAGMHDGASRATRHRRVHRALVELNQRHLIAGGAATTGRFRDWTLLSDDGSERAYEVPGQWGPAAATVRVPSRIFFQGWHLVLEPRELAVLLMVAQFAQAMPYHEQVGIPPSTRYAFYGLPADTYSESIHELGDFGLMDVFPAQNNDGEDTGDSEQPRITHRIRYPSTEPRNSRLFDRSALEVVLADLENERPGRLYDLLTDPRGF